MGACHRTSVRIAMPRRWPRTPRRWPRRSRRWPSRPRIPGRSSTSPSCRTSRPTERGHHMPPGVTDTPRSERPPAAGEVAWHTLSADQVLGTEGVAAQRGLSSAEAAARAQRFGPNKLAEGRAEPRWHAFVRQYREPMQLVLLAAGIGSLYPIKQYGTGILLVLLTLFNAVMGLQQEGKAAAAVAALQKTMIIKARVRRDGQLADISAEQLVPGDIVLIQAGDVVPAGGRPLNAATVESDGAAL